MSGKGGFGQRCVNNDQVWPVIESMFSDQYPDVLRSLAILPEVLSRVWPMKTAHLRSLPADIGQLSRILTSERGLLRNPYWSKPAFVSAYLHYFLPWNLIRLTRLFARLPFCNNDPGSKNEHGEKLFVDVGSGPLTLPIALWLARPDLRKLPVRVLAIDSSLRPLALGKAIWHCLAEKLGAGAWPVHIEQAPLLNVRSAIAKHSACMKSSPWLLSAANVLNEQDLLGSGGENAEDRLETLFGILASGYGKSNDLPGNFLFVEPGTRLGGSLIMQLRKIAVAENFRVLSPCTHNGQCSLLARRPGRSWCHFTFDCSSVPQWLTRLSMEAGLAKNSLSISYLLCSGNDLSGSDPGKKHVRVISSPFAVDGLKGQARYACGEHGLFLLENAAAVSNGSKVLVRVGPGHGRDRKSGAIIAKAENSRLPRG